MGSLAVLDSMIYFQFLKKQDPTVKEMSEYISKNWKPINEKTLRYHLLRMKKMGFLENGEGKFSFKHPATGDRFDAHNWSSSVFDSFYKEVSAKIGEVVKEIKNKNAMI